MLETMKQYPECQECVNFHENLRTGKLLCLWHERFLSSEIDLNSTCDNVEGHNEEEEEEED